MYEHVRDGGSLYVLEQENDKAYISTASSGNNCICTYADMKYVMQEIRMLESADNYLPDAMKTHRNENGKLYQIGGPTENEQSDIEYVSMVEQDFFGGRRQYSRKRSRN